MQTIWSRTVQARSCQCISCIHATTTVARRATTAVSKSRLSGNDVFTACYSAMFATAALMDMKRKDERRKQWDMAIAEAKASNNVSEDDSPTGTTHGAVYEVEQGQSRLQDFIRSEKFQMQTKISPSSDLGAQNQISIIPPVLAVYCGPNSISASTGKGISLLENLNIKVQDAYFFTEAQAMDERRATAGMDYNSKQKVKLTHREPVNDVHLESMKEMVWDLVNTLLKGNEQFATMAPIIRQGRIEKPQYTLTRSWMCEEQKALDFVITSILEAETSNPSNINLAVSKICYNLLISAAPPSILTYNTMLIYFTRLKAHHLSQAVIDSFIHCSMFRPTFTTVAAMLDHYAAIGDKYGFHAVIQRMRGIWGHMRVTRSTTFNLGDSITARAWEPQLETISRGDRIFTKMPLNPHVFNSLILGVLSLYGHRRALSYFKRAIREGYYITGDLFDTMGKTCLTEGDRGGATSLLSVIISRWYRCKGVPSFESLSSSREIILQLMDMCDIELWSDGNHSGTDRSKDEIFHVLKAWLVALRTEVLDDCINQSASAVKDLETVIAVFNSNEVIGECITQGSLNTTDYLFGLAAPTNELGAIATAVQLAIEKFARVFKEVNVMDFNVIRRCLSTRQLTPHELHNRCMEATEWNRNLKRPNYLKRSGVTVLEYRVKGRIRPVATVGKSKIRFVAFE